MTLIPRSFYRILLLAVAVTITGCNGKSKSDYVRNQDFNEGWKFSIGDKSDAKSKDCDLSGWTPVDLPHDWSIVDYDLQDSLHIGPFYRNLPGGVDVGYLRDGIAWYRKNFKTPKIAKGRQVILDFDGVQTQMELWVNDEFIGEHVHGYTPFQFDISSALNSPGEPNIVAVKTINKGENSRWFAGAGIYRDVKLSILNPLAISPWGVTISSSDVSSEDSKVNFGINVLNLSKKESKVRCEVRIVSGDKLIADFSTSSERVSGNSNYLFELTGNIPEPLLWSIDHPNLYEAIITVYANNVESDKYKSNFGIRSIEYNVDEGFLLNGEEILMKGACIHHDNGLLGAAAFPMAEHRRVKILKKNGFNAIRTSHNPPSTAFLDACDHFGMLVIDEAFDHWEKPKRPNDYSNYFREWHIKDVQAMVLRDRNHPSIVMWSFGNEVQERADPRGIEIGKTLISAIREIDNSRPITQAICDFWDNPGRDWDYSASAFEILDIGGYNYKYDKYESDHQMYPDRIMYGSESVPMHAWENWEMVKRHKYVIGDFVWTGMDYIGESGIGHNFISDSPEGLDSFLKSWPWYNAWCGDIDLIGNKKPQSLYRDVVWGKSNLEILVSKQAPEGKYNRTSYWGWYDELSSWNWKGHEGKPFIVRVVSSYPEVRLTMNGNVIGTQKIDSVDKYIAEFRVNYQPGNIEAMGILNGFERESYTLWTSRAPEELKIIPEEKELEASRSSIAFINVQAKDKKGLIAVNDESQVTVNLTGPAELMAAGNAGPVLQGSFTDNVFKLFRGKGLVIIRSTGEPGEVSVTVSSDDLESTHVITFL